MDLELMDSSRSQLVAVFRGIARGHESYGLGPVWVYSNRNSLIQKKPVSSAGWKMWEDSGSEWEDDCPGRIASLHFFWTPVTRMLSPRLTRLFLFLHSSIIHMNNCSCFLMPGSLEKRLLKSFLQLRQVWITQVLETMKSSMLVKFLRLNLPLIWSWVRFQMYLSFPRCEQMRSKISKLLTCLGAFENPFKCLCAFNLLNKFANP